MEKPDVIHILIGGRAVCGFHPGLPCDWPSEHKWGSAGSDHVTCDECQTRWEQHRRIGLSHDGYIVGKPTPGQRLYSLFRSLHTQPDCAQWQDVSVPSKLAWERLAERQLEKERELRLFEASRVLDYLMPRYGVSLEDIKAIRDQFMGGA